MNKSFDLTGLPDPLQRYRAALKSPSVLDFCCEKRSAVLQGRRRELAEMIAGVPDADELRSRGGFAVETTKAAVEIQADVTADERARLEFVVRQLIPWRKGPFKIAGLEIDAEWRSDLKWERIAPQLDALSGKRVLDIGANTGYYMFRMLDQAPDLVLGLEPSERCWLAFQLLNRLAGAQSLSMELVGYEELPRFGPLFDVVLCMGILYHARDPLTALRQMEAGMAKGGQIIVESMAIPGAEPVALFPESRYAKMRNVFFIPTGACLCAWVKRAGFIDVELFSEEVLTVEEQRVTTYASGESLESFLDARDPSRTVEGYPAPLRVAVKARKRG